MNARLLLVHALSPLHAGTGQGVGVIDLPIAREKATGLPFLPGSSLKGTIRDQCKDLGVRKRVFGPSSSDSPDDNPADYASSVQFSDQRLLLLPIRSVTGLFAWVTSPYILHRFLRDAQAAGVGNIPNEIPKPGSENDCLITQGSKIAKKNGDKQQVVLEDLDLQAGEQRLVEDWATWIGKNLFPQDADGQRLVAEHICIVQDDTLNFLLETATEITARIKLMEEAKTVERGGLWYEEALPSETVLAGLIVATHIKASPEEVFRVVGDLVSKPMQFGGKATVGRGICSLRIIATEA